MSPMTNAPDTMAETQTPAAEIALTVNGARTTSRAATLADLLVEQGFSGDRTATALNGAFIARDRRAETPLAEGDAIEILTARQGG